MSTHYSLPTSEEPYFLPFYIEYKRINPDPQYSGRPSFYNSTPLRAPPKVTEAFRCGQSSGILAWTPGSLQTVAERDFPYLQHHKTSSVYWCPTHQTYLAVDFDCTLVSVRDRVRDPDRVLDDWERLKFGHESIRGQCVSVMGHRYSSDELAAIGSSTWMNELIPALHQRQSSPGPPGIRGPSLLAGDLSLLLGIVALSSPVDPRQTIQKCFRPQKNSRSWVPHGHSGHTRSLENGIVMSIFFDPRQTTKEDLEKWEAGNTHPILE